MSDSPGFWAAGRVARTVRFAQFFETCVVCLIGKEAPSVVVVASHGTEFGKINGMVIYGCTTWSHEFKWMGLPWPLDHYVVKRTVENKAATGIIRPGGKRPIVTVAPFAGKRPSETFITAVQDFKLPMPWED